MRSAPSEATTRGRATASLLLPALLFAAVAVPVLATAAIDASVGGGASRCARVAPARAFADEVRCGGVRLQFKLNYNWMNITCEQNGTLACEELREARPLVDEYRTNRSIATNRTIEELVVQNCILPSEQLRCPLQLVGANDTVRLILRKVQGTLLPLHVEGMQAVDLVYIHSPAGKNITLPYEALSKLPSLRALYVRAAALVLAPDADHSPVLEQLKTLELNDVGLKSLPRGGFRNTPSLEYLTLENNDIEYIDEDAFLGLRRLADMSLEDKGALRELPSGVFRGLPLRSLWLENKALSELPADIFRGLRLEKLVLRNALRRLPADLFYGQDRLFSLDLKNNALETLDESLLSPLSKLRDLILGGNSLQQLSTAIFHIPTLERLDLSRNNLSLSCSNGSHGASHSAQGLRVLHLSYNRVSVMCEEWRVSRILEVLDLAYNEFTSLSSEDTTFFNDADVYLVHNRIRHFHLDYSRSSVYNPTFRLGHNPLLCDCELHAVLAARAAGRVRLDVNGATCADPPSLRNVSLTALPLKPPTCL